MNLIKELGTDYVKRRFNGALFFDEDRTPAFVDFRQPWKTAAILPITRLKGTIGAVKQEQVNRDAEFFKSMKAFATPALGWRTAANGKFASYYWKDNRSTLRGLSPNNTRYTTSPLTNCLHDRGAIDINYYSSQEVQGMLIMVPEYLSLREGISKMKKGEIISFAVSGNMAVFPDEGDKFAVWFNQSRVGTISDDGKVECNIDIIRNKLREAL